MFFCPLQPTTINHNQHETLNLPPHLCSSYLNVPFTQLNVKPNVLSSSSCTLSEKKTLHQHQKEKVKPLAKVSSRSYVSRYAFRTSKGTPLTFKSALWCTFFYHLRVFLSIFLCFVSFTHTILHFMCSFFPVQIDRTYNRIG